MKFNEINSVLREAEHPEQVAINRIAERVAAKYGATEYEAFETEMKNILRPDLRELADLPELFDLYNPARQHEGGEIWNRMMKNPDRYIR